MSRVGMIGILVVLLALGGRAVAQDSAYVPSLSDGWQTVSPESVGFDTQLLERAAS